MTQPEGAVRRFASDRIENWQQMGELGIQLGSMVEKEEGEPLSAYYARFAKGATAPLPASYSELWVVLSGALTLHTHEDTHTVSPGEPLHVPKNSPGEV